MTPHESQNSLVDPTADGGCVLVLAACAGAAGIYTAARVDVEFVRAVLIHAGAATLLFVALVRASRFPDSRWRNILLSVLAVSALVAALAAGSGFWRDALVVVSVDAALAVILDHWIVRVAAQSGHRHRQARAEAALRGEIGEIPFSARWWLASGVPYPDPSVGSVDPALAAASAAGWSTTEFYTDAGRWIELIRSEADQPLKIVAGVTAQGDTPQFILEGSDGDRTLSGRECEEILGDDARNELRHALAEIRKASWH